MSRLAAVWRQCVVRLTSSLRYVQTEPRVKQRNLLHSRGIFFRGAVVCTKSSDPGFTFSFLGNTIHVGVDQTGAPYVSFHGADGTNSVTRGEPK